VADIVVIIWFLGLLPVFFLLLSTFNRLVRIQRLQFHDDWLRDDCPNEWLTPRSAGHYSSVGALSKYECAFKWLVKTPAWAKTDELANALFFRYHLSWLVWTVGILLWILVFEVFK